MAERGELTLDAAASRLGVSKTTVLRLISAGATAARQVCKGAPWAVPEAQIEALRSGTATSGPRTVDANQKVLDLQ